MSASPGSTEAPVTTRQQPSRFTSGSLRNTNASLVDTSGSLRNTSGVLVNITGRLRSINGVLISAQRVNSRGTALIPDNVLRINRVLRPVQGDTAAINNGLGSVNTHLTSICRSTILTVPVPGLVTPSPEC